MHALAFAYHGVIFASAGETGIVRIWDVASIQHVEDAADLVGRQPLGGEFSLHAIPIGRDENSRIDRIRLPDTTLRDHRRDVRKGS